MNTGKLKFDDMALLLSCDSPSVPLDVQTYVLENSFEKKAHFHITLLKGVPVPLSLKVVNQALGRFHSELEYELTNQWYVVEKAYLDGHRKSLIVTVTVPVLPTLLCLLRHHKVSIPTPVTHVTVFTGGTAASSERGIGLYDETTFAAHAMRLP